MIFKLISKPLALAIFYLLYGSMFSIATIIIYGLTIKYGLINCWLCTVAMGTILMIIFESLKN